MMVFKRKQVVILSLVLIILVVGFLQYSYNKSSSSLDADKSGNMGAAVYVDNQDVDQADKENTTRTNQSASQEANQYFAQAKLEKDMTRDKNKDSLKDIANDPNADSKSKKAAYDAMTAMSVKNELEMRLENLIVNKGFSECIAIIGDNGGIDIVVKAPSLDTAKTAQIADIVSRQANIPPTKVVISNKF